MKLAVVLGACLFASVAHATEAEDGWQFSASLYGYDVPESDDYLNPNFTADRGRLHFEARYNYEAIDSGSLWAGANFSVGESWVFDSTVMLGGVFGDVEGVAPGYRLSLTHGWFELASEGEYFITRVRERPRRPARSFRRIHLQGARRRRVRIQPVRRSDVRARPALRLLISR
jgi:hypothetical protein